MEERLTDISSLMGVISEEEKAILDEKENALKAIDTVSQKMKEELEQRSKELIDTLLHKRLKVVEAEKQKLEKEMKNVDTILKRESDKALVERTDACVAQTVSV